MPVTASIAITASAAAIGVPTVQLVPGFHSCMTAYVINMATDTSRIEREHLGGEGGHQDIQRDGVIND